MSNTINEKSVNAQNILITGAGGQLGSEFRYLSGELQSEKLEHKVSEDFNFIFVTRKELNIQNSRQVEVFCQFNKVDVIVNCAAYTSVDKAEQEGGLADAINHLAVKNLAKISKLLNIKLVHISTDYVFDGTNHKPYVETDRTNPQSVYGKTKLDGERAMQAINLANSIIIRTSWVYSSFGNNFVRTMLRLAREKRELSVVCDQIGSPTYARDLAVTILQIIPQLNNNKVEVYHYSNGGICSWYDFAKAIFEINKIDCHVSSIPSSEYATAARRPSYSVLDKRKSIVVFNIGINYWRESLQAACKEGGFLCP